MFTIRRCLSITPASANGTNENGESYANSILDPAITPGRSEDNFLSRFRCPGPNRIDHRQRGDAGGVFEQRDLLLLDLRPHVNVRAVFGWPVCLQADTRHQGGAGIFQRSRPKARTIFEQEISRANASSTIRAIAEA